jgi:diadenosine tetraphosphate (Ap4A) HIT family hydrolase
MTTTIRCPYCEPATEPSGGWIYRDDHWLVACGPPDTTMAGAVKITSVRHYTDFAEMTPEEATAFGPLVSRLDEALRATIDPERVHLVSTRDRVPHFHAWLYPRPASHPLRGTEFLAAPQQSTLADTERVADAMRAHLA